MMRDKGKEDDVCVRYLDSMAKARASSESGVEAVVPASVESSRGAARRETRGYSRPCNENGCIGSTGYLSPFFTLDFSPSITFDALTSPRPIRTLLPTP